jgi:hypothetical protein
MGIKQCVQETANHDVISAYLNCRNYDIEWERRHGMHNKKVQDIMRREVNEWAMVQKDISGFEIVIEEYKKRMDRYGARPDMIICPPKLSLYGAMVPITATPNSEALGIVSPSAFKTGEGALGSLRGLKVYETRMFDVYENELPIDLLRRHQQIGEYYTMTDPYENMEPVEMKGKTHHRDIVIYDEKIDNFRRIKWAEAVEHVVFHNFPDDGTRFRDDEELNPAHWGAARADTRKLLKSITEALDDKNGVTGPATREKLIFVDFDQKENLYDSTKYTATKKADKPDDFGGDQAAFDGLNPATAAHVKDNPTCFTYVVTPARDAVNKTTLTTLKADLEKHLKLYKHISSRFGMMGDHFDGQKLVDMAENNPMRTNPPLPRFIHDRVHARLVDAKKNLTPNKVVNVSPAKNSAYVSSNGVYGVYTSSIGSNGSIAKPTPGDREALFVDGVHTKNEWKSVDVAQVMKELRRAADEASTLSAYTKAKAVVGVRMAEVVGHCQDIINTFEHPEQQVGNKRSRIVSRQQYGTKRVRTVDDILDNVFEEEGVTRTDAEKQLAYAKRVVGYANKIAETIGVKVSEIRTGAGGHWTVFNEAMKHAAHNAGSNIKQGIGYEILLLRPYMTYEISSAILTKGGYSTGATFVGHSDFILGDDVVSKLHYGNFTFYSKAVVQNAKQVIIARNIFCQGYVGGNDCTWRKVPGTDREHEEKDGSLVAVLLRKGDCKKLDNPIDITGHFLLNGQQDVTKKPCYPNAPAVAKKMGFDEFRDEVDEGFVFHNKRKVQNTVCYQGHQWSWAPSTAGGGTVAGSITNLTCNTGHWGRNVYAGCGRVRAGEMKYLEKCNYQNAINCLQ